MGYVFFDTETTGLNRAFDQIVQFAAVHTDHDLKELGRFEVRSRLQPHVVPHPAALRTNGLSIARLTNREAPSHYVMICEIRRRLLAWSPAIFAGYNSIAFDEHMLRHGLFQSLFPAYLTSHPKNGRADAYGLVQTARALTPGCLVIPRKADSRPSFKLADLTAANSIAHAGAHDAMSDVLATIELCRLVKDRSTEAWQRFVRFSNKAAVADFVDGEDGFILTEFFGGDPRHRAVASLGTIPTNPNGRFCLDLATPPDVWRRMSDTDIRTAVARAGTPVRRLRVNGAPTLTNLYDAEEEMLNGLTAEDGAARAREIKDDKALRERIVRIYTASWADIAPSPHLEERLYTDGFPCQADEQRMLDFHEASWPQRLQIARAFEDPRLRYFAERLIHGERRSLLDDRAQRDADSLLARRLMGEGGGGPLSLLEALKDTEELMSDTIGDPFGRLAEYRDHLVDRVAKITRFQGEAIA